MSISPLPLHMSCYGVTSEAVSMARYGHGGPYTASTTASYSDRLAAAKATFTMPSAAGGKAVSSSQTAGKAASATTPARAAVVPPRITPQPLAPHQAAQLMAGHAASSSAAGPSASHAAHVSIHASNSLDKSKLLQTASVEGSLQVMDFASIADSSTGGGGVPRPYGRFTAARGQNGTATWQRLPPAPGSWQAKALPLAVTVLTEEEVVAAERAAAAAAAEAAAFSGRAELQLQRGGPAAGGATSALKSPRSKGLAAGSGVAGGRSHSTSRLLRGPFKGLAPATYPGPGSKPLSPAALLLQQQQQQPDGFRRRPGSAVHRLLTHFEAPENGAAASGWFALPAATFLCQAPHLPANVRMDCGLSIGRDFLKSGLNPAAPTQPGPAAAVAGPSVEGATAAGAAPGGAGADAAHSLNAAAGAGNHTAGFSGGPSGAAMAASACSPSAFRGVYVPIDNSAREARYHYHSHHAQHAGGGSMEASGMAQLPPEEVGRAPLVSGSLPPEALLPRRNVPPKW